MSLGDSSVQWDLRMPIGSRADWLLSLFADDGVSPFPIAGHTFEYVVRQTATDTGSPLVRLQSDNPSGPTPANGGLLTVVSSAVESGLKMSWYPAATSPLTAKTYFHALWMDYADPNARTCLWQGQFMLNAAAPQ